MEKSPKWRLITRFSFQIALLYLLACEKKGEIDITQVSLKVLFCAPPSIIS